MCCAASSKPGSKGTDHQLLILAFKTFPMPACLSSVSSPLTPTHTQHLSVSRGGQTDMVPLPAEPLPAEDLRWVTEPSGASTSSSPLWEWKYQPNLHSSTWSTRQGHTFIQQARTECLLCAKPQETGSGQDRQNLVSTELTV